MFISKKTAYAVLKEKKLSPSYEKFKQDCKKRHWKRNKGRVAVAAILQHFGLEPGQVRVKTKMGQNEVDLMKFLNTSEVEGIEID